jgi:hypothetical protein
MADRMNFMGWINVSMALVGACSVWLGARTLATGRLPRRLSDRYTDSADWARYLLGFGLFLLLQVIGYAGVEFGIFGTLVRGCLVLLAFVIGAVTVFRYRPRRDTVSRR